MDKSDDDEIWVLGLTITRYKSITVKTTGSDTMYYLVERPQHQRDSCDPIPYFAMSSEYWIDIRYKISGRVKDKINTYYPQHHCFPRYYAQIEGATRDICPIFWDFGNLIAVSCFLSPPIYVSRNYSMGKFSSGRKHFSSDIGQTRTERIARLIIFCSNAVVDISFLCYIVILSQDIGNSSRRQYKTVRIHGSKDQ